MEELRSIELGETTSLRLQAWRFRNFVLRITGRDLAAFESMAVGRLIVGLARRLDRYIEEQVPEVIVRTPREVAIGKIRDQLETNLKYRLVSIDEIRPWGAVYQIDAKQTGQFISDFFPGVEFDAELLTGRLIVVYPGERLSFKYHQRRSESWRFLTPGAYYRSSNDEQGSLHIACSDELVHIAAAERNRLCAPTTNYTIVAEVWQHSDAAHPSNEDDCVRLADDYER